MMQKFENMKKIINKIFLLVLFPVTVLIHVNTRCKSVFKILFVTTEEEFMFPNHFPRYVNPVINHAEQNEISKECFLSCCCKL